jgi:hypothetical protein
VGWEVKRRHKNHLEKSATIMDVAGQIAAVQKQRLPGHCFRRRRVDVAICQQSDTQSRKTAPLKTPFGRRGPLILPELYQSARERSNIWEFNFTF